MNVYFVLKDKRKRYEMRITKIIQIKRSLVLYECLLIANTEAQIPCNAEVWSIITVTSSFLIHQQIQSRTCDGE